MNSSPNAAYATTDKKVEHLLEHAQAQISPEVVVCQDSIALGVSMLIKISEDRIFEAGEKNQNIDWYSKNLWHGPSASQFQVFGRITENLFDRVKDGNFNICNAGDIATLCQLGQLASNYLGCRIKSRESAERIFNMAIGGLAALDDIFELQSAYRVIFKHLHRSRDFLPMDIHSLKNSFFDKATDSATEAAKAIYTKDPTITCIRELAQLVRNISIQNPFKAFEILCFFQQKYLPRQTTFEYCDCQKNYSGLLVIAAVLDEIKANFPQVEVIQQKIRHLEDGAFELFANVCERISSQKETIYLARDLIEALKLRNRLDLIERIYTIFPKMHRAHATCLDSSSSPNRSSRNDLSSGNSDNQIPK